MGKRAEQKEYIPQILVIVRRGITDSTPVLVYPWEVPILEIVHGEGNVEEAGGAETERWLERTGVHQPRDTVIEMHGGGEQVRESYDPTVDIAAEYGRMGEKYGMHSEVAVANVEYVYGQFKTGQFEAAVLENIPDSMRAGREAAIMNAGGADQLTGAQVRSALDSRKIKYKRTGSLSSLRQLLNQAIDQEREKLSSGNKKAAA